MSETFKIKALEEMVIKGVIYPISSELEVDVKLLQRLDRVGARYQILKVEPSPTSVFITKRRQRTKLSRSKGSRG